MQRKGGGRRFQSLAAGKAGDRPQGFKYQPRGRPPRGRRMSHVFTRVPPSCQSILRAKRGACLPGDGGAGWRSGCGTYEPCETLGRFYAPVIRRQRGPRPWEFNGVTAGKCQPDPGLAGVPMMVRCSLGLRFPGCKMRGVAQVP